MSFVDLELRKFSGTEQERFRCLQQARGLMMEDCLRCESLSNPLKTIRDWVEVASPRPEEASRITAGVVRQQVGLDTHALRVQEQGRTNPAVMVHEQIAQDTEGAGASCANVKCEDDFH